MGFDLIVAIDGPSGVGKSTVARAVAGARALHHLDTGATYRAATVAVLEAAIDPEDEGAVVACVEHIDIGYDRGTVTLNGADVTRRVREPDVTAAVSVVAAHAEVRDLIVGMQRAWVEGRAGGAVVEGRDIGSVVFPDAPVKVFLTAAPEVRAARRAGDAEADGSEPEAVARELARRDHIDSTREASPLQAAPGAHVIDTSEMGIDDVVDTVLEFVDEVLESPRKL
jgi:cytidylate kinase